MTDTTTKTPRKAVAKRPTPPAAKQPAQRPYLLESTVVRAAIAQNYDAALAEIEAVEADMLAVATTANNDIALIRERADAEIAARTSRRDDLRSILAMCGAALGRPVEPPADNAGVAAALGDMRRDPEATS